MSTLGTEQLLAKKFTRLELSDEWSGTMGNLAEVFMIIIYGESGEGKTEFCYQLAKELSRFGNVKWMGYETGHAASIQDGVARNSLKGLPITWDDPWDEKPKDKKAIDAFVPPADMPMSKNINANRLFIALYLQMSKAKSAKYWFLDSADATGFTEQQVLWLWAQFKKKKGVIYIAHGEGKKPLKAVSRAIEFYGDAGIVVKSFIARPLKSRFGGFKPRVVFEDKARELDPLFFEKIDEANKNQAPKKKKKEKAPKVTD